MFSLDSCFDVWSFFAILGGGSLCQTQPYLILRVSSRIKQMFWKHFLALALAGKSVPCTQNQLFNWELYLIRGSTQELSWFSSSQSYGLFVSIAALIYKNQYMQNQKTLTCASKFIIKVLCLMIVGSVTWFVNWSDGHIHMVLYMFSPFFSGNLNVIQFDVTESENSYMFFQIHHQSAVS